MQKVITGIIAGVIVFAWGMLSWMVLPFHKESFKEFRGQPLSVKAITGVAPESGMYVHPTWDTPMEEAIKEPHILTVVSREQKNFAFCMLKGLLIQIFAGLVLTCLVSKANLPGFKDKLLLILKVVVFAGIVGVLPNWLWWSFTTHYTVLGFVDLLVGWLIAGLVIAKRT